jgi:hypothetical protein
MPNNLIDLTGQRFGKLTVIERTEDYVSPKGYHSVRWLCQCDCGNIKSVTRNSLLKQHTRSCGCLCKEGVAKARLKRWHKDDNSEIGSTMINKEDIVVEKVVDNMDNSVDNHVDNNISFVDAYSKFENWLNNQRNKTINTKSTMLWSALKFANDMNIIDEDTMKKVYGEFMFKQMEQ